MRGYGAIRGRAMRAKFNFGLMLAVFATALHGEIDDRGFTARLRNCTELIGFGPVPLAPARSMVR